MIRVYILALVLLTSNSLFGKTHHITPKTPVSQIQSILDSTSDGDTVSFAKGNYPVVNLFVHKSITLRGDKGAVLLSLSGDEILTVEADDVYIENLEFRDVLSSYLKESSAIRIVNSFHYTIKNCRFVNCFFAIYLQKSSDGKVLNNYIKGDAKEESNSGNGIHAWYCKRLEIKNNEISQHRDGIYFEFVDSSFIVGNNSYKNIRYGLHFMFSNKDSYTQNTFRNNGVGVAVMFSRNIEMRSNIFIKNWGTATYGLLLKEIYDAEIIDNQFIDNTTGINVEGSNRIVYKNNNFIKNGWAICFKGGCEDNQIIENNFEYNTLNMMVGSKLHSNSIRDNYWSDYTGYDLDKDGTGDVPFYPVNLFSYILNQVPESVVLLRSMFVSIINLSERVSPIFTPKEVLDPSPKMTKYI